MSSDQQRYRVLKRLASGGMAEVFVAEALAIEGFRKQVAIKRVLPQLSKKDQFIAMFLDEARLSGHLSHSNCVSVFDIGVGDGTYFIVMEYVDGGDLKAMIEHYKKVGRTIPVEIAVFIAIKICQGLSYAHELAVDGKALHIIHRDITPANILMTKHGEVKIVDFGLAKASSQLAESDAGIIKGKFGYLAPETVLEMGADQRVDIFSVGIMLWEMLAGRRLFLGETDFATVRMVRDAVIPSLAPFNETVPPELEQILLRSLARDRERRYTTARELGRDLLRFLYWYGRPVNEDDVAELVRTAVGGPATLIDPSRKIAELIDLMLLEFKSLKNDAAAPRDSNGDMAALSLPSMDLDERQETTTSGVMELGGLADELEGPDPSSGEQKDEESGVARWLRGVFDR